MALVMEESSRPLGEVWCGRGLISTCRMDRQTDQGEVGGGCQGRRLGKVRLWGARQEGRLCPAVLRPKGYPMSCASPLLQTLDILDGAVPWGLK